MNPSVVGGGAGQPGNPESRCWQKLEVFIRYLRRDSWTCKSRAQGRDVWAGDYKFGSYKEHRDDI